MPRISIDTFEGAGNVFTPLDSPRSLEAALRCGVDLDELYPRSLNYFISRADGHKESLAKVLAEHYESRRKDYVNEVRAERKRILTEEGRARAAAAKLLASMGATAMTDGGGGGGGGGEGEGGAADAMRELAMAQGRARIEAERKRMEFSKLKAAKELEDRLAGEKGLAEKAARDRELQDAKAAAAEDARKERVRRTKKEAEAKRSAEEDKLREAEERDLETRKLIAAEFEKEKKMREKAAVAAKVLLLKRKTEEEEARVAAMEADRAREEQAEIRAEALKVSSTIMRK